MAEWSKALDLGSSPKGRGFEPHSGYIIVPHSGYTFVFSNAHLYLFFVHLHLCCVPSSPKRPQPPPLVPGSWMVWARAFLRCLQDRYDANMGGTACCKSQIGNPTGSTSCNGQYQSVTDVLKMAKHAPQMGESCVTSSYGPTTPSRGCELWDGDLRFRIELVQPSSLPRSARAIFHQVMCLANLVPDG